MNRDAPMKRDASTKGNGRMVGDAPTRRGAPLKDSAPMKCGAPLKDGAPADDGAPVKNGASMKSGAPAKPPRLARRVLAALLPGRLRWYVLDDLDEAFRSRVAAGREARGWYRRQVVAGVWPALRLRWRTFAGLFVGGDVRPLRYLRRSRGFTLVTVLTLALGFAATITNFTLVDGILLRPLPFPEPERLVVIKHAMPGLDVTEALQSTGTYFYYGDHAASFTDMGLFHIATVNVTGDGEAQQATLVMATASVFSTLGAVPLHGRLFAEADMEPDSDPVIVLSHALWRERYGSDVGVVGRNVVINNRAREVVGVLPPDFELAGANADMWMNNTDHRRSWARFANLVYGNVARLAPGVSYAAAEAELRSMAASLAEAYDDITPEALVSSGFRARVVGLHEETVGDVDDALWTLAAAVALVLLIAAANVANLFLVRAEYRRREVAVRRALGAGTGQLFLHFLGESLLPCALGALLGLGLSAAAVRFVVVVDPGDLPRLDGVGLDARVMGFAAALTIAGTLGFALISMARHGGTAPAAVREGAHGATLAPASQRAGRALVALQTALAVALLIGALLLVQSFASLRAIEPGFEPDGVLALDFALPADPYTDYGTSVTFFETLRERVEALPQVEVAGAVGHLPLAVPQFPPISLALQAEGSAFGADDVLPEGRLQFFLPASFESLHIDVVAGAAPGRDFADAAVNPIVINESLARQLYGEEPAVGKRLRHFADTGDDAGPWWTVAAVADDVLYDDLTSAPTATVYLPVLERPAYPGWSPNVMTLVARADGASTSLIPLIPLIRAIVRDLDPNVPIANVRSAESVLDAASAHARFAMALLLAAAVAAVFLGAVGVYGVASYAVGRRTREIGVRMAIGASAVDIRRMVLRQGAGAVLVGLIGGLTLSASLARFVAGLLYGVRPMDPVAFAAAPLLLLLIALLATLLPARRAARVDPAQALGSGLI